MRDTMDTKEAIDMMNRCKEEIRSLRARIERLEPKAEAYDNMATLLRMLPRPSVGMSEDLVWVLDKRIREMSPKPAPAEVAE